MPEEKGVVCIGIDVAKDTLEVASAPRAVGLSVKNAPDGFAAIKETLKAYHVTLIVLEATGGYERKAALELLSAGYAVVVANPRQVRDFARGIGQYAKTDKIDAGVLADFAQLVKPKPRPEAVKADETLSELVLRRHQLVEMRVKETNRSHMSHDKAVERSITTVIKALDKEIDRLEKLISKRIQSDDTMTIKDAIIQSTPGIGSQTSAMLLGRLPELGILNRQEIAALTGVSPWDIKSGKSKGKSVIWGGRSEVRSMLYMATRSAMNCNPVIKAYADRLSAAGKPYKVVAVACMRKLLTILNSMVRTQTQWQS
jgi:transposase